MKELTLSEFQRISEYIKKNYGITLGAEKKSLIYSRLKSELEAKGFQSFTEYFDDLLNDRSGEAIIKFINRVTTNHTFFMREPDHFVYFKDCVLPYIAEEYAQVRDLRLWCAASSTGEEPYTLQMIINDFFADKPGWNTEILATDISVKVLQKAVNGVYSEESIKPMPEAWKKRYFRKHGTDFAVTDDIKSKVFYRKFNLMEERLPFKKKFQVIFCRNVMIYFDTPTKDELIDRFADVLEPGGFLFVGHSETVNMQNVKYKYVKPAIYRRV